MCNTVNTVRKVCSIPNTSISQQIFCQESTGGINATLEWAGMHKNRISPKLDLKITNLSRLIGSFSRHKSWPVMEGKTRVTNNNTNESAPLKCLSESWQHDSELYKSRTLKLKLLINVIIQTCAFLILTCQMQKGPSVQTKQLSHYL